MSDLLIGYTFDPRVHAYRNLATGRLVARARILELLDAQVTQRGNRLARLTLDFASNQMDASHWLAIMKDELRRAALEYAALGRGGWERLDAKAWGRVGGILQADLRRLIAFADDIASEKLSEAQILNRLGMYLGNMRRNFWDAERDALRLMAGRYRERRVLGISEHCDDCVVYARLGWQPFGVLPVPGERSQCLTNCRCILERQFIKSKQGQLSKWTGGEVALFNPRHEPAGSPIGGRFAHARLGSATPSNTDETALNAATKQIAELRSGRSPTMRYRGVEAFVLEKGAFFPGAPKPAGVKWGVQKQCYMNAYKLADSDSDRYAYVEGLALPDFEWPMGFEHAWVVDRQNGQVVDNTWRKPGRAYFGVEMPLDKVRNVLLETKVYGVLPEAYRSTVDVYDMAEEADLFNPRHYPAGPRGGQFAPAGMSQVPGTIMSTQGVRTVVGTGKSDFATAAKNGKIATSKYLGGGVCDSQIVEYQDDGRGVWKGLEDSSGDHQGWHEVAAYELSEALGLHVVPKTVYAKNELREPGTAQEFLEGATLGRYRHATAEDADRAERILVLDYVIRNGDRHGGNYLWDQAGHLTAIDHGHARFNRVQAENIVPYNDFVNLKLANAMGGTLRPKIYGRTQIRIPLSDAIQRSLRGITEARIQMIIGSDHESSAWAVWDNIQDLIKNPYMDWHR